MIVKSDIGHLPPTLKSQFANGVGRTHPLWRIANQGLGVGDLGKRIEFHACMAANNVQSERAFKLNLPDADPLAERIANLASEHKLSKSRIFEILVHLGWNSLQAYGAQIGHATMPSTPPSQPAAAVPMQPAIVQPESAPATPPPTTQHAKPQEPEFCDTPEFAGIAQNMLAQFGIDVGIPSAAQQ